MRRLLEMSAIPFGTAEYAPRMAIFRQGDVSDDVRRHSAIALTRTRVLVIARAHWPQLLQTEPVIRDRFIEHLLTRETRLEKDLTDQILYPAGQRLAHTLLVLAGCDAGRACRGALPDISQELIAEIVGTTRSRVNAFMGKFKKVGFIEEDNGRLFVCGSRLPLVCGASRGVVPAASWAVRTGGRWKSRRHDSSTAQAKSSRRLVISQLAQPEAGLTES